MTKSNTGHLGFATVQNTSRNNTASKAYSDELAELNSKRDLLYKSPSKCIRGFAVRIRQV